MVTSPRAVFATDLLASLDRSDTSSAQLTEAYRPLALAYIAYQSGLPKLCAEISWVAMGDTPALALAHAMYVQTQLDQDRSTAGALTRLNAVLPDSGVSLFLSAREKVAGSGHTEAMADVLKLLSREPDNFHVRYLMSQLLVSTGQTDTAIDMLEELYAESALRPSAMVNTSVSAFGQYDTDADPLEFAVANDLACLLAEHRPDRLEEAYRIAREVAGRSKPNGPMLDTLGWIEHLRGNDAQALKHLCRAVAIANAEPQIHAHLAVVYRTLGIKTWAQYHSNAANALAAKAATTVTLLQKQNY